MFTEYILPFALKTKNITVITATNKTENKRRHFLR